MSLKDPWQCEKLASILRLTYGSPAEDQNLPDLGRHILIWNDQKNHNRVLLIYQRYPPQLNYDDDCDLKYEPFVLPAPGQL
jgi:hypothetical protein